MCTEITDILVLLILECRVGCDGLLGWWKKHGKS